MIILYCILGIWWKFNRWTLRARRPSPDKRCVLNRVLPRNLYFIFCGSAITQHAEYNIIISATRAKSQNEKHNNLKTKSTQRFIDLSDRALAIIYIAAHFNIILLYVYLFYFNFYSCVTTNSALTINIKYIIII